MFEYVFANGRKNFDFDIKSILFAVDLKWFDWMAQNDLIGWLSEALFKNSSPTIKFKLHKARTHSSSLQSSRALRIQSRARLLWSGTRLNNSLK